MPAVIIRLPLIIPPAPVRGAKGPANLLTALISLVSKGYQPFVLGCEDSRMDAVTSLDAATITVKLMLKDTLSHDVYHVTNGDRAVTIGTVRRMIEEHCGRTIPTTYYDDIDLFWRDIRAASEKDSLIGMAYAMSQSFLLEPVYPKIFDNRNTLSDLHIATIGQDPTRMITSALERSDVLR